MSEIKKDIKTGESNVVQDEGKKNIEKNNDQNEENKKKKTILIISIAIIILILLFSTLFALVNSTNTKIITGIYIKGIDVGGLTIDQAKNKIKEITDNELLKDIEIEYNDFNTTINPIQFNFEYDINTTIEQAYQIGRSGNIIQNNYSILNTLINKKRLDLKYEFNDENLKQIISDIEVKLPDCMKQYSYYIEDQNLFITPGKEGTTVQKDKTKELILKAVQKEDDKKIILPVQQSKPKSIDIEQIHNEVYTEAKDAYYTTNPYQIYPHVVGVDFNIDEAKQELAEEKAVYSIPLTYTEPKITTNKIGMEAFPDLLSSFSTKYDATNINRSINLNLAAKKINGTILMPGEEFSYNQIVGERTIASGYKEAKIYSNGKVIDGLGGGICQISSTLYNAVLYANLEITERRNHQFVTSYVKAGLDATVVYGSQDFKFKNSRNYPIKIVIEVKNGIAKIDIYGVKEEAEYEIRLEPVVLNYIPFTTSYINDTSLEPGVEVIEQKGNNGVKTVTYKYLVLNGNIVSKIEISRDTYNPMQKIIRIGV